MNHISSNSNCLKYTPLNKHKEEEFENILEELKKKESVKNIGEDRNIKKRIINNTNTQDYDKHQSHAVNVLFNNFTKTFINPNVHNQSDLIQSALEYNRYLIKDLNNNEVKQNLSKSEYEYAINSLWENLNKLARNCDSVLKHKIPVESKKYCEKYSEFIITQGGGRENKEEIGENDQNTSNIHHHPNFLKKKRRGSSISERDSNFSGLNIIINKSILKE